MSDPLGLVGHLGATAQPGKLVPSPPPKPLAPDAPEEPQTTSFKDVLMANIDQVNQLQQDAEQAIEDLYSGRRDDVDGVLIAKQKADMAFQLLLQVRNKLVDAYEEVQQMRV